MKITLEPGGPFPPSPLVAANIRAALEAASIAVDDTIPDLQPGTSLTAWFDQTDGSVKFYTGLTPVTFQLRHSIVSETAPANPVNGLQWLNSNDGGIYTWYNGVWVAGDVALPFGVNDLMMLLRASLVSDTPPESPTEGQQWFRTSDGYVYTWYDGTWVAGESSLLPVLSELFDEMQTKATKKVNIFTISDPVSSLLDEHADSYGRFTSDDPKTYTVVASPNLELGTTVTLRNVGASDLTVDSDLATTLLYEGTANVVPPKGSLQLVKVGEDVWDLI